MIKIEDREFVDDQLRGLSGDSVVVWKDDIGESYTLNFMLEKPEWKKVYEKLLHNFNEFEEDLFFYPHDRLHMTLLGWIDPKLDKGEVGRVVKEVMVGKKFTFDVGLLGNNNMGIFILAKPVFNIEELRSELRERLVPTDTEAGKYTNIFERYAWINFIRFKNRPGDKFFETLWKVRGFQFGEYEAKDIDIYLNSSRTLDPNKCKLIEKIVF